MVKCRVCNSKDKTVLYKKYGFNIAECGDCGLVYTDFRPTQKFLKDYYSKSYFVGGKKKLGYDNYSNEEASSKLTARKRIDLLKTANSGSVLDVGCAYGFFLSEMPNRWSKYGLEISKFAYKKAIDLNPKAKIQNRVLTSKTFAYKKFDLITMWDVIEHLDNPKKELGIIYSKLKKGGKLALSTGDVGSLFSKIQGVSWHLYTPPQHLSFFSAATAKKLLKSVGFKNISVSHPSAYYPISYITHKLSSVYGIKLPRISSVEDLVFPVNLGDIMLIVATK